MKSKNTKKNSATKSKFGCDFCGRSFAKESTIDKHICEYKRRWGDKNLKGNRIGFNAWLNFYAQNTSTKKPKTYLDFTKSSITLSEALDYETPFDKLNFLNSIIENDLPKDYTIQQAAMIKGMSVADINAVAKAQLKPDNMVIIVVGHAYKVRDGLNNLGYGKIKEITVD